jgi:spore germination protein YaaH
MAEHLGSQLSDALLSKLQKEQYVLLSTLDEKSGAPVVNAVSWVYAPDARHIKMAVGHKSRIVSNVKTNARAAITVIGPNSTYTINGKATVTRQPMEDVTIKLAEITLEVEAVQDVMFYGAKISREPEYVKTYDQEAADKLDRQVMAALKKA